MTYSKRLTVLALVAVIIVLSTLLLIISTRRGEGIVINFYSSKPLSDTRLFVQVYAVMPDQPSIEVYRGLAHDSRVILDENNYLSTPLKAWLSVKNGSYKTALIVNAWLIESNRALWVVRDKTILYDPVEVSESKQLSVDIYFDPMDSIRFEIPLHYKDSNKGNNNGSQECYYIWVLESEKSFTLTNMEIALLLINNSLSDNNLVTASLTVHAGKGIETYLGLAYGYNLEEHGLNASGLKMVLGRPVFAAKTWFSDILTVYPGQVKYMYINGTITHEFYRLHNTCQGYTGYDKEQVLVNMVNIGEDDKIVGGQRRIGSNNPFMNFLQNYMRQTRYTTLYPGDSISLSNIHRETQECAIPLSINVATGALLAANTPIDIPITLAKLMSNICTRITNIDGALQNNGSMPGNLYLTLSDIEYRDDVCLYRIPLSYFIFTDKQ